MYGMSTVGAVVARQGLWREGTELEKMDKPFGHTCPFPSLMQILKLFAQYRLRATPHPQRKGYVVNCIAQLGLSVS